MAEKIRKPIFLALVLGGGIACGTAGLATAVTNQAGATAAQPYPPRIESDSDSQTRVEIEIDDPGCWGPRCHVEAETLPMTGAPVKTLATAGAGLLLVGATGTLIAVRRRRSASAK